MVSALWSILLVASALLLTEHVHSVFTVRVATVAALSWMCLLLNNADNTLKLYDGISMSFTLGSSNRLFNRSEMKGLAAAAEGDTSC